MPNYRVHCEVTEYIAVEVSADSPEAAADIVERRGYQAFPVADRRFPADCCIVDDVEEV